MEPDDPEERRREREERLPVYEDIASWGRRQRLWILAFLVVILGMSLYAWLQPGEPTDTVTEEGR